MHKQLKKLIKTLRKNKQTISFAESCTGGLLSAKLAAIPGVSDVFVGAIVSYSNEVKMNLLKVKKQTLQTKGAVSKETAEQMAKGVRKKLKTDYSISITGIAGPTGGSLAKPVGTVWVAVAGPGFVISKKAKLAGNRISIQAKSAAYAINQLLDAIR